MTTENSPSHEAPVTGRPDVPLPGSMFDEHPSRFGVTDAAPPTVSIADILEKQRRHGSLPLWRIIEQELSSIRPGVLEELRNTEKYGSAVEAYLNTRSTQLAACSQQLAGTECDESAVDILSIHDALIDEALLRLIHIIFAINPEGSSGAPGRSANAPLAALALSGGGIRSATLALGVLQALARTDTETAPVQRRIFRFDYLSTVSGGGYIGSWFKAWLTRLADAQTPNPLGHVANALIDRPDTATVSRLREYSNFLSPRLGAFSADTWTLISLASRNVFLNWLLFIPLALVAVGAPWILLLLGSAAHDLARTSLDERWRIGLMVVGALFFFLALGTTAILIGQTQRFTPAPPPAKSKPRGVTQSRFVRITGVPLVLGALLIALAAPDSALTSGDFGMLAGALGIGTALASGFCAREEKLLWAIAGLFAGALFAATLYGSHGLLHWAQSSLTSEQWLFRGLWLSVPLTLLCASLSAGFYIGISSLLKDATDLLHEWWARFGGWVLLVVTGWLALVLLTVLLPQFLLSKTLDGYIASASNSIAAGGGLIGIITAVWGFFDSSSPADSQKPSLSRRIRSMLLPVGAAIFACAIIGGCSLVLLASMHHGSPTAAFTTGGCFDKVEFKRLSPFSILCYVTGGLSLFLVITARVINYSRFTLHALYRERLVRAYLGASNTHRNPDRFTGFDPDDNIRLHEMRHVAGAPSSEFPFHLINMTLNLTSGGRLDWQERKGESFTASILHAGTSTLGYRDIKTYAGPPRFGKDSVMRNGKLAPREHTGMTLGGAVAASGAAASPNMGYNSSPLVAFLLTFFNVRLGVWLPNPGPLGKKVFTQSGPTFALLPAISDLLGLSDDKSKFVNITDGGHFDNMGIYELVRRGVRVIVCIDGECDHVEEGAPFIHEGLAQSIRKCSIDFGVQIESDSASRTEDAAPACTHKIKLRTPIGLAVGEVTENTPAPEPQWNKPLCPKGYWLARIHYPGDAKLNLDGSPVPGSAGPQPGYLLYIKPVLFGDLPVDLRNYHASNPDFPQQTTADQWFSESQFESYRKLGAHLATEVPPEIWKRIGL